MRRSSTWPASTDGVLLRRDILDALLLDLQNRHATRANDLALTLDDDAGDRRRMR